MNNLPVLNGYHDLAVSNVFELFEHLELESVRVLSLNFHPLKHSAIDKLICEPDMTVELILSKE
jgi:hypothetical protein